MPLTIFKNTNGQLERLTKEVGFGETNGLWNCLAAGDVDKDGDLDFVIGNHGLNSRLKATKEKPMSLYVNDFDKNKTAEQLLTVYNGEEAYPLALRHDLVLQLPSLKKKYLRYANYKAQTIHDIFEEKQVRTAATSRVLTTETSIAINKGDGTFEVKPLPMEAQFAPMHGLLLEDFNQDGHLDILMGGNFYRSKPEVGIYDGSHGLLLLGDGEGDFMPMKAADAGFFVKGEIRDLSTLKIGERKMVLVARNNGGLLVYEYE